jgi:branched-chain amino acid transport system substrate-binding protein
MMIFGQWGIEELASRPGECDWAIFLVMIPVKPAKLRKVSVTTFGCPEASPAIDRGVRKFSLLFSLAAIVLAGVTLVGCQKKDSTIKIGLAAVQSGSDAAIGATMLNGAQVAIDEWNAKGGVLGKKIETISLDDEAKPDKAVNVAQSLVDDGVVAVIGHLNSNCTIPASRVYNDGKVIQITPGSTNPQYTEQGFPYAFRICGRDDQQGPVSADFLHDVLKLNKIAILHNKSSYGEGLATEVKKAFEAKGGQVVFFQGIGQDESDFRANLSVIQGSGAQGFFWGGMYGQGGPLFVQMRQAGLTIPFCTGDGCFDQSLIDTVGGNAANLYLSFGKDYRAIPAAQAFIQKYKEKYQHEEGAYSVYGYDAANVLLTAIAQAGTTDPDKVSAVMKSQPFDTILGKIQFDAKGDVTKSGYIIWTIKDGKFQVVPGNG